MNRALIGIAAAVFLGHVGLMTPRGGAQDVAQPKTGSIKGKVTVTGVRNAENVLVYLEKAAGEYPPPKEPAEMDQQKLTFVPHVLPILKGTTVRFINSDSILHNVFWNKSENGSYPARNLGTWGKDGKKEFTFDKEGSVVLLCNVHSEMEGHIVVLQNPFFALVGADGAYELKEVPPGQYTVKAWYPNPKKLKPQSTTGTVTADQVTQLDFSLSGKKK
jgi:plastocyanin